MRRCFWSTPLVLLLVLSALLPDQLDAPRLDSGEARLAASASADDLDWPSLAVAAVARAPGPGPHWDGPSLEDVPLDNDVTALDGDADAGPAPPVRPNAEAAATLREGVAAAMAAPAVIPTPLRC